MFLWLAAAVLTPLASCRKAVTIVDRALDVSGGVARIERLDDIVVEYRGTRYMLNQSRRYGARDPEPWSGQTLIDLRNRRLLGESVTTYPVAEVFAYRWVLEGDRGFVIDLQKNNQGNEALALDAQAGRAARANFTRNIPVLLLLEASQKPATLRYAGTAVFDGKHVDTVTWVQPDGTLLTMYFDDTHLLYRHELLQADGIEGDVLAAMTFPEYARVGGIMMPVRRIETANGIVIRELMYTSTLNSHPPDERFQLPAGYVAAKEQAPTEGLRKLADNVWIDPDAGNALVVAFEDYLVIMEAPVSSAVAEGTIRKAKAMAGQKAIRYLSVTHHHTDHAGGLRAYVAEGATIVTTPGNRALVDHMVASVRTLSPDRLSAQPRAPIVEIFTTTRRFEDSKHSLVLYNIGPASHAEELTIGYLPKERILFQADMFFAPSTGPLAPAFPSAAELFAKLDALGLQPETVIDPDGRVATIDEVRRSIALATPR